MLIGIVEGERLQDGVSLQIFLKHRRVRAIRQIELERYRKIAGCRHLMIRRQDREQQQGDQKNGAHLDEQTTALA
jgi:hypothetical protein